eukprot:5427502-Prymnesium_polylepis.1
MRDTWLTQPGHRRCRQAGDAHLGKDAHVYEATAGGTGDGHAPGELSKGPRCGTSPAAFGVSRLIRAHPANADQ